MFKRQESLCLFMKVQNAVIEISTPCIISAIKKLIMFYFQNRVKIVTNDVLTYMCEQNCAKTSEAKNLSLLTFVAFRENGDDLSAALENDDVSHNAVYSNGPFTL